MLRDGRDSRPEADRPGTGRLQFAHVAGRTVVTRAFAVSPLKLLQPANAGRAAWVYASTYGGGLVNGDHIALDIDVGEGASAFVSTQASTKIYRSPAGTTNTVAARVARGGTLVSAPDPVVCFAGANCRQTQTIDLSADAGLVLLDWFTSGRRARGERWQFDNYEGRLVVRREGRLIVYDAVVLRQTDGELAARLDRTNVFAVATILGPAFYSDAERVVSGVAALPVQKRADVLQTASLVANEGCVLRVAGVSLEAVSQVIRQHLSFLPRVLGDDPWARKW